MKKIISLILSVVMVFSIGSVAFGVSAFAEGEAPETDVAPEVSVSVDLDAIMNELAFYIGSFGFDSMRFPTDMDDFTDMLLKFAYGIVDKLIDVLLKVINTIVPSVDFADKDTYVNEQFYPGMEEYLVGADISEEEVCVNGNVITSKAPGTAIPFALKLIEVLVSESYAEHIKKEIVFQQG